LADKFVEKFLICDKREQGYSAWIAQLSKVNDGKPDILKAPGDKVEPVKAIPADECSNTLLISEYYIQPLVPSVREWASNSGVIKEHAVGYAQFAGNRFTSASKGASTKGRYLETFQKNNI
jgi:type II secretory pathway pseudopilin PulG